MAKPLCYQCKKDRPGRFIRIPGDTVPFYRCFTCVPDGKGKGEKAKKKEAPKRVDPEEVKQEGLTLVSPINSSLDSLRTPKGAILLQTEEDYQNADAIINQVGRVRRMWADRMEPIIRPISDGLQRLYALRRDVDTPLNNIEKEVKAAMKQYKLAEAARIVEEVEEQPTSLDIESMMAAAPRPIQADATTDRKVKKWRGDLEEFIIELAADLKKARKHKSTVVHPNLALIGFNEKAINTLMREQGPEVIDEIPGLETYDDIEIVRR